MVDEVGDRREIVNDLEMENTRVKPATFTITDESRIVIPLPVDLDRPNMLSRYLEVVTTEDGKTELLVRDLTKPSEPEYITEREGYLLLKLQKPSEPLAYEEQFGLPRPANPKEIREGYTVATDTLGEIKSTRDLDQISKHQKLADRLQSALTALPNK